MMAEAIAQGVTIGAEWSLWQVRLDNLVRIVMHHSSVMKD